MFVCIPTGSNNVPLEKLRYPGDICPRHLAVDADMFGIGYDPYPVFWIIGDVV